MQLEKPVMAQGNVEVWLGTLLEMSRKSVHHVIRTAHTAVQDQGFNLLEFLSTFPAQVLKLLLLILKGNDWAKWLGGRYLGERPGGDTQRENTSVDTR